MKSIAYDIRTRVELSVIYGLSAYMRSQIIGGKINNKLMDVETDIRNKLYAQISHELHNELFVEYEE